MWPGSDDRFPFHLQLPGLRWVGGDHPPVSARQASLVPGTPARLFRNAVTTAGCFNSAARCSDRIMPWGEETTQSLQYIPMFVRRKRSRGRYAYWLVENRREYGF